MPEHVRRHDPPSYPHSAHELTPEEVREHYGDLLERFYAALRTDPQFVADVAVRILKACDKRDRRLEREAQYREAKASRSAAIEDAERTRLTRNPGDSLQFPLERESAGHAAK